MPCAECKAGWYEFIGEELVVSKRLGVALPRPKGGKPPCWKCPKLSAEDQREDPRPEKAVEMTERGRRAWRYYHEVQAGASMADDPVTRRICGSLLMVEKAIEREGRNRGT